MSATSLLSIFFLLTSALAAPAKRLPVPPPAEEAAIKGEKVLWEDPGDISQRDLLIGEGGREAMPTSSEFEFVKEEMDGTNPKFKVRDSAGNKWKLKLGDEARPETAATRLVWAVGFHTDEDFFLPKVHVTGLPSQIHRGKQFIDSDGTMHNVRLEREVPGLKKLGAWKWTDNPFTGTREWYGLRVMMALVNNWDLKDENNSIYEAGGKGSKHKSDQDVDPGAKRLIYVVSDLGATFGPQHLDLGRKSDKGDLEKYEHTSFPRNVRPDTVDFAEPGSPSPVMMINPADYFRRRKMTWIGHNIRRQDAQWMGTVLARLSGAQIRDAFRAGGFTQDEVEAFALIIEQRIEALKNL